MNVELHYSANALLYLLVAMSTASHAFAQQTTAFTYQGQLRDAGTNANGTYTMSFKLCDQASGGNQIGTMITNQPTLANGLFSVNLDFGASAFNGDARWLEITVEGEALAPRVQIMPAPYALFAATATTVTDGSVTTAKIADASVNDSKLAANAVAASNIQTGAVTANKIASGQVVKNLNGLTDSVILAAGANIVITTNGNSLQLSSFSGGGGVNGSVAQGFQLFVSDGTFYVSNNVTRIMVGLFGGGGGGGNGHWSTNGTSTYSQPGGGGGGGGYVQHLMDVTPGTNFSVIVGQGGTPGQPGGNSSFGGFLVAGGGTAGGNATHEFPGSGGYGGAATGGSMINLSGQDGGYGNMGIAGNGGGTYNGHGGFGFPFGFVNSRNGKGPGGGGGGGGGASNDMGGGHGAGGGVLVSW